MNQLRNSNLIHFNNEEKLCFDRAKYEEVKMRL